ncbi:hypothetical protein V1506DRAFT_448057, partial [Lipomyces tetrasporus]
VLPAESSVTFQHKVETTREPQEASLLARGSSKHPRAGLSVLVLEAKDRTGGKARSVSNDGNKFIELGAAWINDTNQSEMWAMAKSTALDTVI